MKKSIIISFFAILTAVGFTSCLDTDSDRFVNMDKDLTPQDSVYHLLGILNNLKEIAPRYVLLGELRGDLMTTTEYAPTELRELHTMEISNTNSYTTQREYYKIINQCNYLIQYGQIIPQERAAAISIRAWVYLQMALTYGKVKYYTEFIHSEAQANADYPEIGIDELVEKVIPMLEEIRDIRLPSYDAVGGTRLNSQMIYPKSILGDYYLWAGHNNPIYYEKAAQVYYEQISGEETGSSLITSHLATTQYFETVPDVTNVSSDAQHNKYTAATMSSYPRQLWNRTSDRETWTIVNYQNPDSTAVRSNIDSLCGYPYFQHEDIAIKQSIVASTLFSTTNYAYVDVTAESEYRTNYFQRYINPLDADYNRRGDLRVLGSLFVPSEYVPYAYTPTDDTVVYKYYNTKTVSIYRTGTLYLRYAEALNRLGKPNLAMIALKYGMNYQNIAMYTPLNETNLTTIVRNGVEYIQFYNVLGYNSATNLALSMSYNLQVPVDIVNQYRGKIPVTITYSTENNSIEWAIQEGSDSTLYLFDWMPEEYYDFSVNSTFFAYNAGLHGRGAGCAAADTTFKMPYEVYPMPVYTQTDPEVLIKQQEYVEDLIAKEYALETAFEGGRFYDLMRISRYQGSPDFLASRVSKKPGAKSYEQLRAPSPRGWDSDSWYLPKNAKEK